MLLWQKQLVAVLDQDFIATTRSCVGLKPPMTDSCAGLEPPLELAVVPNSDKIHNSVLGVNQDIT